MRADVNGCRQEFMRGPTNNYLAIAALCLAAVFSGVIQAGQSVSLKAYEAQKTSMSLTLTLNEALATAFANNLPGLNLLPSVPISFVNKSRVIYLGAIYVI